MTSAVVTRLKRRGRILLFGIPLILIVVGGISALVAHRKDGRRELLATEIQRAGGYAELPKSLVESIRIWRKTGKLPPRQTNAHLLGETFNNQWIRERDYLRDFKFRVILCDSITGDDLARLIDSHPVDLLNARDVVLTEEVLRAIRDNSNFTQLLLGKSKYTDAQLAALPLERLEHLALATTGVTSQGLLEARRCRALNSIELDGSQLTDEVADLLAALGTLRAVFLFGSDVSDEHIQRLHRIGSLELVQVVGASISENARKALTEALPTCKASFPVVPAPAEPTSEPSLP